MRSASARRVSSKLTQSVLAAAALAGVGATALGQVQLTWSPLGVLPGVGGHGIWDTATDRWDDGAGLVVWNNANVDGAAFTGAPGVVLLPGALTAGSLEFGADYRLIAPQIGIGTLTSGTITLAGAAPTINTRGNRVELIGPTVAASGLTKVGTGVLIVHGVNSVTGNMNVNEGTLAYGNTAVADFPSTTVMNIAAGAAVDMGNWSGGFFTDTVGDLTGAGNVYLGTANGLGVTVGSALIAGTLNSAGTSVYSGSISGGGRFSKQGAGTLVFSGANTYTGPTSIEAGTLRLDGGAALADTNAVFVSNVASVRLLLNADEAIGSIGGGGTTGGTVDTGAFNLTIGGDNTFNGFAGTLAGSGRITKIGSGLQAIQNATPASTFTGKYELRGGTFSISADTRLGPAPGALVSDHITLAGGVFANSAAGGMTLAANRGITVTAPSGIHAQGVAASNFRIQGPITGSDRITKTGLARLTINGTDASFTGGWNVVDGQLATESLAAEPFGSGRMNLNAADLVIAPAGTAADNLLTQIAQGSGNVVTFGPGSVIQMNRGVSPTQRIVLGNAGAGAGLVRNAGGTLVLKPTTAANLGTPTDQILISGAPVLVNGIMPGVVATNNTAGTNGHLVNYDNTNGVVVATYSSTDLSTSILTDTVNQTTNVTLTGPSSAYGLRVGDGATGVTITNTGQQIRIGNGTDPAMLVINKNSIINGGSVNFGTAEGVIFTPSDSALLQLNADIAGTNGIHKIGDGGLALATTAASYSGRTRISGGTITLGGNDFLPTGTDLELLNTGKFNLNGFSQTVRTLNGSRGTTIQMGIDGKLTVGSGSGQFLGNILNNAGSTTSTITKDGPGVLTLGEELHTTALPSGTLSYNKLAIKNGGVVAVSAGVQSLPAAAGTVSAIVPDNIALDGGTLRIQSINSAAFGSGGASTYTLSSGTTLRGMNVGPNGGTIEVSNPKEIVIYQRANGATIGTDDAPLLSGSGVLTKTGPGFLRLGIGNTGFTGKWVLKDGNVQFQDDRALGADPGSLVTDYITFDGGMLQSNGSGTIGANRGITVAAGGGRINNGGPFLIFSPLTGTGPLEILQGASLSRSVQFNAQSPNYSGVITLTNGRIDVTATDHALGTGTVELLPKFPVAISKTSGAANSRLGNNINFRAGSTIDIRVDGGVGSLILAGDLAGPNTVYKSSAGAAGTFAAGGQGTLVLSGNNTFTGDLVIKTGAVVAESATALGSAAGSTIVYPGAALAFQSAAAITEGTGSADDLYISGTGVAGGGALVNIAGSNSNGGAVNLMQDSTVTMLADALKVGPTRGPAKLTRNGAGTYQTESIRVRSMDLQDGTTTVSTGALPNSPAKVSTTGGLSMLGTAVLDLTNNAMVVRGETLATVEALVDSGYAAAAWNGPGINSSAAAGSLSTAIGVASGADFGGVNFLGQTVALSDVLLRYVRYGDANLSGTVNIGDFAILASNFNLGGRWGTGDFNYDGTVNIGDFSLLAANFNLGVPGDLPRGAAVPEPVAGSLLAIGGLLAGRRRR